MVKSVSGHQKTKGPGNLFTTNKIDFIRNKGLYLLTLPAIFFFLLFNYIPMAGAILAFKDYKFNLGIFGSPWAGLKNFKFFFTSQYALFTTLNTLLLNTLFIVFGTLFQVVFALLINEVKEKLPKKIFQSFMFFPYFISWVIVSNFVYNLFSTDYGAINGLLETLGLAPVNWYSEPSYWPAILTLIYIWKWTGYGVIIYLAVITGINAELYEASAIDGTTRLQQVWYITLPFVKNTVIILTLLAIGRIFYGDFGMIYGIIQDNGTLFKTTEVIDTYVFRALRKTGDIGMASAVGLYQSVVGFILVLLSNFLAKKHDEDSALF